jgi:hypothetical protein
LSIKIGSYEFEGPYFSIEQLKDQPGVYAILCPEEGRFSIIDVSEASNVKSMAMSSGKTRCWQNNSRGTFLFSAYYTPTLHARAEIERAIREQYNPPCNHLE